MTYNKLPGGKAQGCETKDFSTKEQKAISKGSKIESEEHGKTAPEEIAADHVVEHGAKYYDQKIGLPAMEKKMENMEKAHTALKPATPESGNKVAYDPDLPPEEHIARIKHHNQMAIKEARNGNAESARWHHRQAYNHHLAAIGRPPELPTHVVDPANKSEHKQLPLKDKEPSPVFLRGSEDPLAKDVVNIKTGKQIKATQKRIENQPTGSNSCYPTPAPVKADGEIGQVSEKVFNKFNAPKENKGNPPNKASVFPYTPSNKAPGEHEQRIARIRESLKKIGQIMEKLKVDKSETLQKPPKSQAQRGAMYAAAAGNSTIGIPKKVGKEFVESDKPGKLPETVKKTEKDYAPKIEETEPVHKSIQYASGYLSKSINSDCKECGTQRHNQWHDTAKEGCKKCGTPMKKSGRPESMPDSVKMLSKSANAVMADEAQDLKKAKDYHGWIKTQSGWRQGMKRGAVKEWDEGTPAQDKAINDKIKYESQKRKEGKLWEFAGSEKDAWGNPTKHKVIEQNDGSLHCNCKGFQFGKKCKHTAEVESQKAAQTEQAPSADAPKGDVEKSPSLQKETNFLGGGGAGASTAPTHGTPGGVTGGTAAMGASINNVMKSGSKLSELMAKCSAFKTNVLKKGGFFDKGNAAAGGPSAPMPDTSSPAPAPTSGFFDKGNAAIR